MQQTAKIRILSPELANKIAAGEVVERPSSVVKELVENSLDAGANRVDVQLIDAGKTLIRVADDGRGMDAEDLSLAFEPHATSKISAIEDLYRIASNGFRGEALASIQSVSRARIVSRTRDAATALEIEGVGGRISEIRETAGAPGTVVEIRDLFYNVPARRRWLKGDGTEFSHITDWLTSLAAANPEVGFSLRHGERKALEVPPGQSLEQRVKALFGDRFSEGVLEVHDYESYARLDAFLAPPATHRPNSKQLLLFVNRRPVKDRSLMQAALLAYREFLPPGRYPAAVLFLEIPPDTVDVNVHPAKTEVRLLEQNRVFSLIKAALTERLLNAGVLPAIRPNLATPPAAPPQARPDTPFEPRYDLEEPPRLFSPAQDARAREAEHRWDEARRVLEEATAAGSREPALELAAAAKIQNPKSKIQNLLSNARGLFQVGATYIVVETPQGMVIIDQHAYHERILYWLLEHRIESSPLERQRLLVPLPLELSRSAALLVEEHGDTLRDFGFELESQGDEWRLRAVPKYSVSKAHAEVVQQILEELAEGRRPETPQALRKSMVEMVACKAAIKAGDSLEPHQIKSLLELGERVPHTFSCPHGRPTTWQLSFHDLEKLFHRR